MLGFVVPPVAERDGREVITIRQFGIGSVVQVITRLQCVHADAAATRLAVFRPRLLAFLARFTTFRAVPVTRAWTDASFLLCAGQTGAVQ